MRRNSPAECVSIVECDQHGNPYIKMGGLIQLFRAKASYMMVKAMIDQLQEILEERDGQETFSNSASNPK
jgi:hypothetical protein